MSVVLKDMLRHMQRSSIILGWVLFTFAATVMGPFNTLILLGDGARLVYWGVIVGVSLIVSHLLRTVIARFVANPASWCADGARIIGMVLVFSPMVHLWTMYMIPERGAHAPTLLRIALFVGLIGTVIQVSKRILRGDVPLAADESGAVLDPLVPAERSAVVEPDPEPEPDPDPAPRLMRRLPDGVVGPVLRLSASDHFVEVVLPGETHSLRMRFTDAIDEMDGVEGYCCHRSHWVTRATITGIEREAGRIYLRLSNGDQVPVSRTYKPGLEEAGIL